MPETWHKPPINDRAARVLEHIPDQVTLTAGEIARIAKLDRNQTYNALLTLISRGLVVREHSSRSPEWGYRRVSA